MIEVKLLSERAVVPTKAYVSDAGYDITATSVAAYGDYIEYGTGLAVNIPAGYVGLLCPRSSVSDRPLIMANSVGVIDSGFTGELKVRFRQLKSEKPLYAPGDRVAQLVIMPIVTTAMRVVDEFERSERGSGAFGSSGN